MPVAIIAPWACHPAYIAPRPFIGPMLPYPGYTWSPTYTAVAPQYTYASPEIYPQAGWYAQAQAQTRAPQPYPYPSSPTTPHQTNIIVRPSPTTYTQTATGRRASAHHASRRTHISPPHSPSGVKGAPTAMSVSPSPKQRVRFSVPKNSDPL
ncbi:hypothetical protein IAT38_002306 [Cryptococcus sp. DSM 104549]